MLTDDLLFASGPGRASTRSADGLLGEIGQLLNVDETHPIEVEGNTDNVPIHGEQFPSNWQLSTARASTVVQFLIEHSVSPHRLTATGYAEQRPAGERRNRGRAGAQPPRGNRDASASTAPKANSNQGERTRQHMLKNKKIMLAIAARAAVRRLHDDQAQAGRSR